MLSHLSIIKGIHPGLILERELKQRKLKKGSFALSLNEYPQTLVSITKGKRRMNPALSLKIEKALGIEEGYFMVLQAYYDIEEEKQKQHLAHPNLAIFRSVLFWDTQLEKIDWHKHKEAVIKRVFERGNQEEQCEITRFYGKQSIKEVLDRNGE